MEWQSHRARLTVLPISVEPFANDVAKDTCYDRNQDR
jgi:hypothetical protein